MGKFKIFIHGIAVPDLWGVIGNDYCDCGCDLGLMGLIYVYRGLVSMSPPSYGATSMGSYGSLWGSIGVALWGCMVMHVSEVWHLRRLWGPMVLWF